MNMIHPKLFGGLRVACRAFTQAIAAILLLGAFAAPAVHAACLADPKPVIYVTRTTAGSGVATGTLEHIDNIVSTDMAHHSGNEVVTALSQVVLGDLLAARRIQELLGAEEDRSGVLQEMAAASGGGDWTVTVNAGISGSNGIINIRMLDMRRGGAVIKAETINVPISSSGGWPARSIQQGVARFTAGMGCQIRQARHSPVIPRLQLGVQPGRGGPGDSLAIALRLTDLAAAGAPEANKAIVLEITTPQGARSSRTLTTDVAGLIQTSLVLGAAHPRAGVIKARFVRADGYIRDAVPVNFYVAAPAGELSVATGKAQLLPLGGDTVRVGVQQNGIPVANQAVAITASGGAVAASTVVTDAGGSASVGYVAPGAAALVDVRAAATLPSSGGGGGGAGGGSAVQASLSYVVDPAVLVSLQSAGDTTTLGAAALKVDVERDRRPVAGATVSFAVSGGGSVSASTASADSVGRAEVLFVTPSRPGASTITATAVVDGQTYTRNVTVAYRDPLDALTREIADVKEALYLDPSDATLSRLDRLRSILQGRGEGARYEAMLGDTVLVRNQLFCTHQRAHDECAAGARSRGETTLGLLKSATAGSSVAAEVFHRSKQSLHRCPYPMFSNERSVFNETATINDIGGPPTYQFPIPVHFFLSLALNDDGSVKGMSWSANDPGSSRTRAYGFVPSTATGPTWTGRSTAINVEGLYGSYFMATQYQASASSSTASFTVNNTAASGFIDLYQASFDNVPYTATVRFQANITLPAAPSPTMCNHASLPTPD